MYVVPGNCTQRIIIVYLSWYLIHIFNTFIDIQFNESGTGYYPILYFNDYWNLAQEYMPLNDTLP